MAILLILTALPAGAGKTAGAPREPLPLASAICIDKARTLVEKGDIDQAIAALEDFTADAKTPLHPYLSFTLGNCLAMRAMDHDDVAAGKKAVFWYKKAVEADPKFSEAWLNLARSCYEIEDFKAAAKGFEEGYRTSQDPKAVFLYYAAVCRFQCDESQKALELFDTLFKKHPDQITLPWKEMLVNILFSLDRYEQALAFATTLTRTDPLEPKWWKALAHIRLKSGNGEKARAIALADLLVYGYLSPMTIEEKQLAGDLFLTLEIPDKAAKIYDEILAGRFSFELLEKQALALIMAHLPGEALALINQALAAHGQTETPDRDLIRLKKDLEQIMAYRESLKAYHTLKFQTGRSLTASPDPKEIQ